MRRVLYMLLIWGSLLFASCGLLDSIAGIHRDKDGKVVSVNGEPVDTLLGIIGTLVPYGAWAATAATAALREYRHHQIVKSGAKDDDHDGKPDPEPPKSAA